MNESATCLCNVLGQLRLECLLEIHALTGSGTIDNDGVEACLVREATDNK